MSTLLKPTFLGKTAVQQPARRPEQVGDVALEPRAAQDGFTPGLECSRRLTFETALALGVLHLVEDDAGEQALDARAKRCHPPSLDAIAFVGGGGERPASPGDVATGAADTWAAVIRATGAAEVIAFRPALGTHPDDLPVLDLTARRAARGPVVAVVLAQVTAIAVVDGV